MAKWCSCWKLGYEKHLEIPNVFYEKAKLMKEFRNKVVYWYPWMKKDK